MRIIDLVHQERLRLSVVAAEPEDLEATVQDTYVTDLPDPRRFLGDGHLVLTSCVWYHEPDDAGRFVGALADCSVAALVVGTLVVGTIPARLVEECRRRRLPLLTVSGDVSFNTIRESVRDQTRNARELALTRAAALDRRLVEMAAIGDGPGATLELFQRELGIDCWIISPTGTAVAGAGPQLKPGRLARLFNRVLEEPATGLVVEHDDDTADADTTYDDADIGHDRGADSVWTVHGSDARVRGYLVCAGDHRGWPPDAGRLVQTLLSVAGLQLDLEEKARSARQHQIGDLIDVLKAGDVPPGEVSARLRLLGVDPRLPTVIVVAAINDTSFPPQATLELVTDQLVELDADVLGTVAGGHAVVLLNGTGVESDAVAECMRAASGHQLLRRRQLVAGVSEPSDSVSQLAAALAVAGQRFQGAAGDGPVVVSSGATILSHDALLSMLSDRVKASFADGLLRPLLDYDARHGSDLITTLRSFLDTNGSWQQSAERLHVHVNTLRYRVSRIEKLTHRDLSSTHDRVDFYLALQCLP
ncbi:PucR family transcriptional regulator [Phytoactinopolyspora endophytica]|uniref:PucR family transcriptional regulator n=1 Tax=Phytoactinopolyspora endophytica TaxID=1642495 RepID=UPI00101DCA72|nr:PucR family transcriptional regulator [Phytoactinopolyspora endophytica]